MKVSRISLHNWRNFKSAEVDLSDRTFLIGPNASGKSNFLDAFRFLRDIARPGGGLQQAIENRGGISKIRCLAARKQPDVEIEVTLEDDTRNPVKWEYSIGITQEPRGYRKSFLKYERVTRNGKQIVSRPDEDDRIDEVRRTQTYLEQINANKEFRDVAKFFESVSYLHVVPQLLRNPEMFSSTDSSGDQFGRRFLERIADTSDKRRSSKLRKIERALRLAVPQLSSLTDVRDERGVPHLEALYKHWRPQGARQREDQFSDGTLRLLGLLWALLDSDSLLLLEEPELSLHTAIVRKLPGLIYRLQKERKRQVIISTHSHDLLSDKGIAPDEVLLLDPTGEGTSVKQAASDKDICDLIEAGWSIGEAAFPRTESQYADLQQLEFIFESSNSH
jgi:predicted ATPase